MLIECKLSTFSHSKYLEFDKSQLQCLPEEEIRCVFDDN